MQLIAPVHNVAYLPYYYCKGMYVVATTRALFIIYLWCCLLRCYIYRAAAAAVAAATGLVSLAF